MGNAFNFLPVFTNKTLPIIWMIVFALGAIQAQAQQIESTAPYQYTESTGGKTMLELRGKDMIPPESTYSLAQ